MKKRRFWLKQSQSKWLAFIVTRCEECGRKKRRKGERNKRKGHLAIWGEEAKSRESEH